MTWPALLGPLSRHEPVSLDLVRWGMREIMAGAATPAQIAAFAVSLRMHGETAEEIAALVDVMLEFAEPIHVNGVAVDTCGTGGDGAHTVNISTMAAVLLAAAGVPVVKHGNRAASSKCGSADVLEALGVRIDGTPADAQASLDALGLTFCFAATFHPALRFAGPARREIGIPTTFNLLGPLANPARPKAQLVGVADAARTTLIAQALRIRGTQALVVRGHDGLDELSIFAPSSIWTTWSDEVSVVEPKDFGIPTYSLDALQGGDAAFNAGVARRLLDGDLRGELAAPADAVLLNAAAAYVAVDAAHGAPAQDLRAAIHDRMQHLRPILESGAAGMLLDRWAAQTNG